MLVPSIINVFHRYMPSPKHKEGVNIEYIGISVLKTNTVVYVHGTHQRGHKKIIT